MSDVEIPLHGGMLAPVVRVGDTVRRVTGPWTPAVHAWLHRLEEAGYDRAPRALGIDEKGREVLTFIEGTCGKDDSMWSDDTLVEIALLMRQFHDVSFEHAGPWRLLAHTPGPGEVICHTDVGWWNVVWDEGRVVGFIDWDWAAPAPRLWDIAHTVWRFAPWMQSVMPDGHPLHWKPDLGDRERRTKLFCEAYGISTDGLGDMIALRMLSEYDTIHRDAAAGDPHMARIVSEGMLESIPANLDWFRTVRGSL